MTTEVLHHQHMADDCCPLCIVGLFHVSYSRLLQRSSSVSDFGVFVVAGWALEIGKEHVVLAHTWIGHLVCYAQACQFLAQ